GYNLPARHVIHAVGPVWHGGQRGEARQLASCYLRSIELAQDHGLASLAFPCISTGIYGYPIEDAAQVAVQSVRDGLARAPLIQAVVFCCFSGHDLRVYQRLLAI